MAVPAALGNFSLGQGSLLTTPLQIAVMTSAIVNNGIVTQAQLVSRITDTAGKTSDYARSALVRVIEFSDGLHPARDDDRGHRVGHRRRGNPPQRRGRRRNRHGADRPSRAGREQRHPGLVSRFPGRIPALCRHHSSRRGRFRLPVGRPVFAAVANAIGAMDR